MFQDNGNIAICSLRGFRTNPHASNLLILVRFIQDVMLFSICYKRFVPQTKRNVESRWNSLVGLQFQYAKCHSSRIKSLGTNENLRWDFISLQIKMNPLNKPKASNFMHSVWNPRFSRRWVWRFRSSLALLRVVWQTGIYLVMYTASDPRRPQYSYLLIEFSNART
jgi:hypothetical protein